MLKYPVFDSFISIKRPLFPGDCVNIGVERHKTRSLLKISLPLSYVPLEKVRILVFYFNFRDAACFPFIMPMSAQCLLILPHMMKPMV